MALQRSNRTTSADSGAHRATWPGRRHQEGTRLADGLDLRTDHNLDSPIALDGLRTWKEAQALPAADLPAEDSSSRASDVPVEAVASDCC
jgi:hypothetical protein